MTPPLLRRCPVCKPRKWLPVRHFIISVLLARTRSKKPFR